MEKNRIDYFDMLRGVAILAVIGIHASTIGLTFPNDSFNFNFTIFWRNSLNFCVPLFITISGYFLSKKQINTRSKYFYFLKKQIPKIYIPLLIWSSVWFSIHVLIEQQPLVRELVKIITFRSSVPYYFIALIIQFYIALPFIKKLSSKNGLLISIFISLIVIQTLFYLRYFTEIHLPVILYGGNMFTFLMFFSLGLFLGSGKFIKISNTTTILLIIFFYFLSCIESYILISSFNQASDAVTAGKFSSFMYSFFLIYYLFQNKNIINSKLLTMIGKLSFGLFLIHIFALNLISEIISIFIPSLIKITYVHQFILILLVTIACLIVMISVNKFTHEKYGRLLGFF